MCHCYVFFTIILAVWPQTINSQSFSNTSALTPTDFTIIETFSPLNSSTSLPTPYSTPIPTSGLSTPSSNLSDITESTPRSTPQSNVTSNSSFTSSKPISSTVFPLEEPEFTISSDVTSTPSSDVTPTPSSDVTPTSDVPPTSPSDVTLTTNVPSTIPSEVTSAPPSDVTPTSDVPPTSPSDVTPTSYVPSTIPSEVTSTPPSDVTPTSDVPSTTPSEVTATSDVPSTSPSDVTESSTEADSTTTTPIPSTPDPTPKWILDDDRKTLEWEATTAGTVIIEAEEGYKLAVKVLKCDIDGVNQEYVIIGPGQVGKGVQFSYKVSRQPSYLFNTNVLYVEFYGTEASTFRANFSRVGEALTTTTTQITTSTQFLPTPSPNDSAVITVFVSGRRPVEYEDQKVLDRFRDAVRMMATEYCFDQNFDLAEAITINNVNITLLMPCHSSWPGYETCAQITFGVPVYQMEDAITPWQGYQLNSNHLSIMWNRYHKKYIDDDINTFDIPDTNSWVKWQIIVFFSATLIFLVVLLVLKYFITKFSRGSNSDDMESIIPMPNDDNELSLEPYYTQPLPPLFENTYQDITPGLSPITNADIHDDLLNYEDRDQSKLDLAEELGESGA